MVVGGISEGDAGKEAWCERRRVEARRRGVYGICCRFAIAGNATCGERFPAAILCQ